MKLKNQQELDRICEFLLIKYSKHLKECIEEERYEHMPFWEGKYDAIYELLMILDSPLWYKLHSDDIDELKKEVE